MRDLSIVVIAFAAGVLVTGIAYDVGDAQRAQLQSITPAPSAHIQALICAHRMAIGAMPGRGCM